MATVLSTTEAELIGFQSQLCRVSHQSAPTTLCIPPPLCSSFYTAPTLSLSLSLIPQNSCLPSRESRQSSASKRVDEPVREWPDRALVAFWLFSTASANLVLNEVQFQVPAAVRGSLSLSPRVKSVKAEGGIPFDCSRIIKGSPESDRWKDKTNRGVMDECKCLRWQVEMKIQRTAIPKLRCSNERNGDPWQLDFARNSLRQSLFNTTRVVRMISL